MLRSKQSTSQPGHTRRFHAGFTLLELAAVLVLLSGVIFALSYKTTDVSIQRNNQDATRALAVADEQLRHFAAWNGRLPCPDTTGNGLEDCSSSKGALPYRTLGMAAIGYVQGETPLRYGVYRNSAQQADLAVTSNAFEPVNADGTRYDMSNRNSLDFCAALEQGARHATGTTHLYTARPDGSRSAMAYMLAEGGKGDADGSNGVYDSLNGTASPGFDAPESPVTSTYDDRTAGRGFNELFSLLRCDSTMRSLHLAANAIALEEEVREFARANQDNAEEGVFMNAVGSAITAWGVLQAISAVSGGTEVLSISSGLLAGVTATCPIPPFAGCALIPLYAAAVSSAGTGLGLAVGASVAAGTALGLQITATVAYTQIADKTGVPSTPPGGGISADSIADAEAEYNTANAEANSAEADYQTAKAAYDDVKGAMEIKKAALDSLLSQVGLDDTDPGLALQDHLYGRHDDPIPPDFAPFIFGVSPALDSWWSVQVQADAFTANPPTDKDGNPLTDADGTVIDPNEGAAEAKAASDTEIADAQKLADAIDAYDQARIANNAAQRQTAVNTLKELAPNFQDDNAIGGLCGAATPCNVRDALDDYTDAYSAEREAFYFAELKKGSAENARTVADGAYDKWQALECAAQGYDYNIDTNACITDKPPGSGAQDSINAAICDTNSDSYNQATCDALSNQPPSGEQITFTAGANDIVDILDAKGTVR